MAKYIKKSTARAILSPPPSQEHAVRSLPGTFNVRRCCKERDDYDSTFRHESKIIDE